MPRKLCALALFLFVAAGPAPAALPAQVNGEPMPSLAPMLEKVLPAVVNINTQSRVRVRNPMMNDPFFRFFFDMPNMPRERIQRSLGSGVIVDADKGLVLTNNHVIANADKIAVTLKDGRSFDAELVGADPESDLAVVRIPAKNLTALPLGDSGQLRVGDFVVAVGDPFGLGQTVTSGIVSALGRHGVGRGGLQDYIQTDAPINPGNSGGALVNLRGELVGINAAIVSPSGGNIGIGFAVPTDIAHTVMTQLVAHGSVDRGTLGIDAQSLNPDLAKALHLDRNQGAVITQVQAGSPAEKTGLKTGDVVISVNGKAITDEQELHNAIGLLPVGETVKLTVLRDGEQKTFEADIAKPEQIRAQGGKLDPRLAGAVLGDLPPRLARQLDRGVSVVDVDQNSKAWDYGLRPDDVILSVNRVPVPDLSGLQKMLEQQPPRLLLHVLRGNGALFLLLE